MIWLQRFNANTEKYLLINLLPHSRDYRPKKRNSWTCKRYETEVKSYLWKGPLDIALGNVLHHTKQ